MAGKKGKANVQVTETVAPAVEMAEGAPEAAPTRRGRTYSQYLRSPSGAIYGPDYNVPEIVAAGGPEVEGVKASALRQISRQGHGSHKGWVITDAEGNPIAGPARAPRAAKNGTSGETESAADPDLLDAGNTEDQADDGNDWDLDGDDEDDGEF